MSDRIHSIPPYWQYKWDLLLAITHITKGPCVLPVIDTSYITSYQRYRPNWFPSFWTQLTYLFTGWAILTIYLAWHFGLDKPTSRCQVTDIMWTAFYFEPVIQGVPFICHITSKVFKLNSRMRCTLSNTTYSITSIAFSPSSTTSVLNTRSLVTACDTCKGHRPNSMVSPIHASYYYNLHTGLYSYDAEKCTRSMLVLDLLCMNTCTTTH